MHEGTPCRKRIAEDRMSRKDIYISKLSLPGKINDELSYTFIEGPLEHQSDSLCLFGIFKIDSTRELYHSIIKEAVKHYLDFYSKASKPIGSFKNDSVDSDEFLFENAIQYVSDHVTQGILLKQEQSKDTTLEPKRVHFVLGAMVRDNLFLSVTGTDIHAIYIYPVYNKDNFSHYSMVKILDGSDTGETDGHRFFSNIISGKVSIPGGTVAVCNQAFIDYISPDQIKQAIMTKPVESLIPSFQGILGKAHSKSDFSAIILKPHYKPSSSTALGHHQTVSHESMEGLISTERGTDVIMTPAFSRTAQTLIHTLLFTIIVPALRKVITFIRNIEYARIGRSLITAVKKVLAGMHGIILWVKGRITAQRTNTPQSLPSLPEVPRILLSLNTTRIRDGLRGAFQTIKTITLNRFVDIRKNGIKSLGSLSATSKAILVLCILFVFLFIQSIITLQQRRAHDAQARNTQELFHSIDDTTNKAEQSLLIDNLTGARGAIAEAEALFQQFPKESGVSNDEYIRLTERISVIKMRLNKVTAISNPAHITSLATSIPGTDSLKFVRGSGTQIILSTKDGLFTLDTATAAVRELSSQTKIPSVGCATSSGLGAYICTGTKDQLFRLTLPDQSLEQISLPLASSEKKIGYIAAYNKRLYVLDSEGGSIFRHDRKGDGFDTGSEWIKDSHKDLQSAIDFTIDGTMIVLKPDNQITQYISGKQRIPTLGTIDPSLGSLTRLWTDDETPYLFALDPGKKRIIVYTKKDFSLKQQLVSDGFTQLKDFLVRKDMGDILILNGSDIYRIPFDFK